MTIDIDAAYERFGPMVLRRCRALLRDEDRALDAMQEVFVKLLRYRRTLKAEHMSSLLYRMATNICLNLIRDSRRELSTGDETVLDRIAHAPDAVDRAGWSDLLDRIFGREMASTRVMAVLHFVDGLTLQETAEEMGLSLSGVRKRLRVLQERALAWKEA